MSQRLLTMRIIWGALLVSTFIYLVVVVVLQQDPSRTAEPTSPLMAPVLALVAVGVAAASIAVPRQIARFSLLQLKLPIEESDELFAGNQGRKRRFKDPDQARTTAFSPLQTAFIVAMALAESVALMGFTLLFIGFPLTTGLPFFAVCWVLMLGRFPTPDKLDKQLEEAYDADLKRD